MAGIPAEIASRNLKYAINKRVGFNKRNAL